MIRRKRIITREFEEVIDEAARMALYRGYSIEHVNRAKELCLHFQDTVGNRRCIFYSMLYVVLMEDSQKVNQWRMRLDFKINPMTIRKYKSLLNKKLSGSSE